MKSAAQQVKSFRALMEYLCGVIGRKRLLVPIPFAAARLLAQATEIADTLSLGLLPHLCSITRDQVEMLRRDNVVSPQAIAEGRTLVGLGIHGEAFEAIVPSYLYRFRKAGQYERSAVA